MSDNLYSLKEESESGIIRVSIETAEDEEEEIYEEIEETEPKISHKKLWKQIIDESNAKRKEIDLYIKSKNLEPDIPENPYIQYLNDEIFPVLLNILVKTIYKAEEMECIKYQKSTFNGIDYIAQLLWNFNPRHPERWDSDTYIFDMDWVVKFLEENPRPYFPFSWVWSRDFAAKKIQSYMRGYWVRIREDVQEMRQFWKALLKEKMERTGQNIDNTQFSLGGSFSFDF